MATGFMRRPYNLSSSDYIHYRDVARCHWQTSPGAAETVQNFPGIVGPAARSMFRACTFIEMCWRMYKPARSRCRAGGSAREDGMRVSWDLLGVFHLLARQVIARSRGALPVCSKPLGEDPGSRWQASWAPWEEPCRPRACGSPSSNRFAGVQQQQPQFAISPPRHFCAMPATMGAPARQRSCGRLAIVPRARRRPHGSSALGPLRTIHPC